jgi:subtilisin family serine protease
LTTKWLGLIFFPAPSVTSNGTNPDHPHMSKPLRFFLGFSLAALVLLVLFPAPFGGGPGPVESTPRHDPTEPAPRMTSTGDIPVMPVRDDRPQGMEPAAPARSPGWELVDWDVAPVPGKPGRYSRAALFRTDGKYPHVRVEEDISVDPATGLVTVLRTTEMVADQVIAKLADGMSAADLQAAVEPIGGLVAEQPFAPGTWLVALPLSLEAVRDALEAIGQSNALVDYSEPDFLMRPGRLPNDADFSSLWHLNNTAQPGKDIDAAAAWDTRTDADGVIVAVIDTGVRSTHEDLAANMWVNPGEIAGNGIDDDGNGYIDDVHGIDELDNDGDPTDTSGHGTHCAGLIGAVGNNGKGVTGVAWSGIQIMALRFIGETGSISDNIRCIDYAITNGAKVINASYGFAGSPSDTGSRSEAAAIHRAQQAGVLFVAAAGNDGTDNDVTPFYPASYTEYVERVGSRFVHPLTNIISVGASDRNDNKAGFSNYGATSVDLMAPGVEMRSTRQGSDSAYQTGQGTSFAAPVVAGAAALLAADNPDDSVGQLVAKMLAGVETIDSLAGLCVTGGRLELSSLVGEPLQPPLPTAWHVPALAESLLGNTTMRFPAFEVAPGEPFTVFQGVRRTNNPDYGLANQTGGALFYRAGTDGEWQEVALGWHTNNGDYQFWKADVPGSATGGVVQYYLRVDFDSGVARVSYIHGSDNETMVTTDEAAARAQPFSLRDRVAWVYHGGPMVEPGAVTFNATTGYADSDLSYQGATAGAVYYTIDGNTPMGSRGNPGNGSTFVLFFTLLGTQDDPSVAGDAMLWQAVLEGLPRDTVIRYRIGFWNESSGEEQYAGYRSEGDEDAVLSFTTPAAAPPVLTVTTPSNGTLDADYTTSKLYLDEQAGDSIDVAVDLSLEGQEIVEAEVWTNLGNRDRAGADANGDGIHDGILPPSPPAAKPSPSQVDAYPADGYFQAHPMSASAGVWSVTIPVSKTGAYRLTARYKVAGDSEWRWYSSEGRRDHCLTVSPVLSRELTIYEINVLNVDATGDTFETRSTFEDLTDADRWNLDYLKAAGANTLWFQPIHPNGIEGREPSGGWDTGTAPYDPGSPYAVKNFFEVMEQMSDGNSRETSMTAFQDFVATADAEGVHVMLDAPFNHTAYDVELAPKGLELLAEAGLDTTGWSATDKIKDREARFFSRNDGANAYAGPATSAANAAVAPDRNDFGKWRDVLDVFFGRYATLVIGDPDAETSRQVVASTQEWINLDDLSGGAGTNGAVTRAVWRYFADYIPYWLEKTGLPAGASVAEQTTKGIDGLRADFGQGMPPQFWEYAINVARTHKWSFVFMTESLDGGAVTYRSNRHFDILNENIVFPWKAATTTSAHRQVFEERRNAYGLGLVLLNNTSHDEAGYADPWEAFIRYAVGGMIDGAPMIMYGQEIGTSDGGSFNHYELNFGKFIPHFKRYNSMQPQWTAWSTNAFGVRNLLPAYSGVGLARTFSPALRSSNRWFLNPLGSNDPDEEIFAVAKYETPGASPAASDVVLAFQNLDRDTMQANTFGITAGLADLLGLRSGRTYNVRNIAAWLGPDNEFPDRRDGLLWGEGKTRAELESGGVFVSLNPVPSSDAGWSTAPFEAQYLKVYDTTAPAPVQGEVAGSVDGDYTIGDSATFSWTPVAADSEGIVPLYKVDISTNGVVTSIITGNSSYTVTVEGDSEVSVRVSAVNPNDSSSGSAATGFTEGVWLLTAGGDQDGDGLANGDEPAAGRDPLVADAPAAAPVLILRSLGNAAYDGSETAVTHGFSGLANDVLDIEFTGSLGAPWEVVPSVGTGNGIFDVEFRKDGDHAGDWNDGMFFRGRR